MELYGTEHLYCTKPSIILLNRCTLFLKTLGEITNTSATYTIRKLFLQKHTSIVSRYNCCFSCSLLLRSVICNVNKNDKHIKYHQPPGCNWRVRISFYTDFY